MALPSLVVGLSCKPSVRAHDAKRDLALCVASDGLWDFVEEKVRKRCDATCATLGPRWGLNGGKLWNCCGLVVGAVAVVE